jgi:hypothetical protein
MQLLSALDPTPATNSVTPPVTIYRFSPHRAIFVSDRQGDFNAAHPAAASERISPPAISA